MSRASAQGTPILFLINRRRQGVFIKIDHFLIPGFLFLVLPLTHFGGKLVFGSRDSKGRMLPVIGAG